MRRYESAGTWRIRMTRITHRVRARAVAAARLSPLFARADVAPTRRRVEFAGMLGRMVNIFGGKAAREGVDVDRRRQRRPQGDD